MAFSTLSRLKGPAALALVTLSLAACESALISGSVSKPSEPAAPAAPAPQFATATDHFAGLQRAGLSGNYPAFADHLKPTDPAVVLTELGRSFRGQPFDVYTQKSDEKGDAHRRMVELRSTAGRLYLYVELDRVPGGWIVAGYELSRNRQDIERRI